MSEQIGTISIPTDNDGFVLLQCMLCGEFFKLRPKEVSADDVIEICCPCCGLKSPTYMTQDVVKLAITITENMVDEALYTAVKKLERKSRNSIVSFKAGKKPTKREEYPIRSGIENMEMVHYRCCDRDVRIKPIYRLCGSYCPFCGVRYDEY